MEFRADRRADARLGVYGRLHEPTFIAVNLAGFSGPLAAKAWLTTGSFLLALVQLVSALAIAVSVPWWRTIGLIR